MKNLNFESKLTVLGFLPLAILLGLLSFYTLKSYNSFLTSKQNLKRVQFILSSSETIESIQGERGISNRYLKGKTVLGELKEQRVDTDVKMETFLNQRNNIHDTEIKKMNIPAVFDEFKSLREEVYSQVVTNEAAYSHYNSIIAKLQEFENVFLVYLNDSLLEQNARRLVTLENAIEAIGKLRDVMAMNLSKNMPITSEVLGDIIRLKSNVDTYLKNTRVNYTPEISTHISDFFKSQEWMEMEEFFISMVKRADQGNFNVDMSKFFNNYYLASNHLTLALKYQRTELLTQAKGLEFQGRTWFLKTISAIFISLVTLSLFMRKVYRLILLDFKRTYRRLGHSQRAQMNVDESEDEVSSEKEEKKENQAAA